jgi:hypothetical protein
MEHLEVEDFDLTPATYRTILQVYNKDEENLGVQVCGEHLDPEEALEFAKKKATDLAGIFERDTVTWDGEEIWAATLSLETVILVDEEESYTGTLFEDTLFSKFN